MLVALLIVVPVTALFLAWFYLFRNNTDIPVSPGSKPIVGHMHHFMDLTKDTLYLFEQRYFEMTDPKKTGSVSHIKFFFQSNFSLNTVTAAEPLLKSNVNINKSFQYDAISGWLKNSVLVLPGQEWQKRRKMLTPAFHFNVLEDFSETMKKHASLFVSLLKADPTKLIVEVIEEATFYSLCETSFGIEFESREEANALFAPMASLTAAFAMRTSSQNPLIQSDWYYNMTEGGKLWNSSVNELNRHIMGMINKAKKALELGETRLHKGKRAFLDQMVYEQAERGEITDEAMIGECNTILLAGHATTTGTIAFCVYYLCRHQDIQERLYKEIADHLDGKDIDDIDHGSLPYLGMVVKETLRLQPPGSIIGRRLTEPMDADGHMLPAGTNLDVSIWWLHRDPEHWDNAEEFDPERFSEENSRGRNPYAFVPFSAGPRNCIGQRFANVETRLFIAALVYNFKMNSEQELGKGLFRNLHNVSAVPGPDFKVDFAPRV
ncbi:probable cytochrome P450 4ac3 [Bolinopsis microptera]|uniref:probable cytochrome P450 4ac3 n=1 Tax=Bolinopsis microptera TaxID=2820187 RepID=UPI003079A318